MRELVCLANGHWSATSPRCQPVQCPVLKLRDYSTMNSTNTSYTTTVKVSCMIGFNMLGTGLLTCRSDAQWSSTLPQCIPVQCPMLVAPGNSYFISMNTSFLGITIQACLQHYKHTSGSVSRLCRSTGQWSGTPIECEGMY